MGKDMRKASELALVTQTLLMAVCAHALLALVLVDLRFSPLFERSHVRVLLFVGVDLVEDFIQRVFHNTLGPQRLQSWDDDPYGGFVDDRFHCHPILAGEC